MSPATLVPFSTYLPPDVKASIEREAEALGVSAAALVRMKLIELYRS